MYIKRVRPVKYEHRQVELLPPIEYERMSDEIVAITRSGYSLVPAKGHEPFEFVLTVSDNEETRYTHYLAEMIR